MIITKGKISIGAYSFPDRKKPMLGIDNGHGGIKCYGSFRSEESADKFMIKLAEFVGAKFEKGIPYASLTGYGRCDYCKYYKLDVNDDPCRDCKHVFCGEDDGWEPIKEEPCSAELKS